MKKLFITPLLSFSLAAIPACSSDGPMPATEQPTTPEEADEGGKILVAYFFAQGHTQAVAERIVELTDVDVYRIEAAEPYAENPYDDSDRIQREAYDGLRPEAANLPDAETIARNAD